MEKTDIITHFEPFVKELSSETRLGTYSIPRLGRKGLLAEGSGKTTRGNTPWKVAQYIIATTTPDDDDDISSNLDPYLSTWKSLMSGNGNQYLILEVKPKEWRMFDWNGNYLGDNQYILSFQPEVYKIVPTHESNKNANTTNNNSESISYLTAIRTKPFLLLAGISGTGKSRIVRKLAQATVTPELQKKYNENFDTNDFENKRWNLHRPANFELIQVKPNWHNSMDVVGYLSNIPSPHYVFTPFIQFIIKAWQNPGIPFFLCLDEMNLAPVEEYFAEFLSAIESRDFENGTYSTDPIIKPFSEFGIVKDENGKEVEVGSEMINTFFPKVTIGDLVKESNDPTIKLAKQLYNKGLTLPPNLIVIGTVNMDETTFSFSRKVLDRAMSIEMNEVNYGAFLSGNTDEGLKEIVDDIPDLNENLVVRPIHATDIYDSSDPDANSVIKYLERINALLDGTPFKLGYRVANEALLYLNASADFGNPDWRDAMDKFTLMKILSRIEGDTNKLKLSTTENIKKLESENLHVNIKKAESYGPLTILTALKVILEEELGSTIAEVTDNTETPADETSTPELPNEVKAKPQSKELESVKKLDSMISQLERERFVSYWN